MPSHIIRIFDFDQTLTKEHSFATHRLEQYDCEDYQFYKKCYEMGKLFARKEALDNYLIHRDNTISAIATFHNNHSFIAGVLSAHFKSELVHNETELMEDGLTAIATYTLPGSQHPIYISFIPAIGDLFTDKLIELRNKNNQLATLRTKIEQKLQIVPGIKIEFYDDSQTNTQEAQKTKQIQCFSIIGGSSFFETQSKVESPRNTPQVEPLNLIDSYEISPTGHELTDEELAATLELLQITSKP